MNSTMKFERIPFEELPNYLNQKIILFSKEDPSYYTVGVLTSVNELRNCVHVAHQLYSDFTQHWCAARIVYF